MVNHYELLCLLSGGFTEEEVQKIKGKIKETITKAGGQVMLEDTLGKRKLAYPIKDQHNGYYELIEFDLEGAELKKLDSDIGLTEEVLRHTIVKRDLKAPSFREITRQTENARQQVAAEKQAAVDAAEAKKEEAKKEEKKVNIEDLDQKLDELLEGDIM